MPPAPRGVNPFYGRSTVNPACSAAAASRSSAQRKLRPAGRLPLHINAAPNCKPSAARNGYRCRRAFALSRTSSLGTISCHSHSRTASCLSATVRAGASSFPNRCSRAIALWTSTEAAHQTTGLKCIACASAHALAGSFTHSDVSALESQKAVVPFSALPPVHPTAPV
jgi:hypothetical protein